MPIDITSPTELNVLQKCKIARLTSTVFTTDKLHKIPVR